MSTPAHDFTQPGIARHLLVLAGWLALTFAAASLGALFLPGEWYASLKKPSWNPPGPITLP